MVLQIHAFCTRLPGHGLSSQADIPEGCKSIASFSRVRFDSASTFLLITITAIDRINVAHAQIGSDHSLNKSPMAQMSISPSLSCFKCGQDIFSIGAKAPQQTSILLKRMQTKANMQVQDTPTFPLLKLNNLVYLFKQTLNIPHLVTLDASTMLQRSFNTRHPTFRRAYNLANRAIPNAISQDGIDIALA